jgi:nitrate reductase gamma subunit
MYEFIRGPLVWIGFLLLICGTIYKLVSLSGAVRKDKVVLPYLNPRFATRSITRWLIPYGTVNMRMRPFFTAISFLFHICLLATPIFLYAHVVLWKQSFGVSWWTLPEDLAVAMTVIVVAIGLILLMRRIADPSVRYVSSYKDFVLLAVVLAPFVSGLLAYYQVFPHRIIVAVHIVTGVVWLAVIPFTRLVHMIFFPLTRAYMGSEFGFRNARDW